MERQRTDIRVRVGVGNEGERGASKTLDLELRIDPAAPLGEYAGGSPDRVETPAPLSGCRTALLLDAPDQLGVEADPRSEGKPAAVDPAERDAACPSAHERVGQALGCAHGVAREAENARQHVGR